MNKVSTCPRNKTEVVEASERIGCGSDQHKNNQYLCLPNAKKTSLVEFCYDGVMGIENKGTCLVTDGKNVTAENCFKFLSGCPHTNYGSHEFYLYPACQEINPQYHCFTSDPTCPSELNGSSVMISSLLFSLLGVGLAVISFIAVLAYFLLRTKLKKHMENRTNAAQIDEGDVGTPLLPVTSDQTEILTTDMDRGNAEIETSTDTSNCHQEIKRAQNESEESTICLAASLRKAAENDGNGDVDITESQLPKQDTYVNSKLKENSAEKDQNVKKQNRAKEKDESNLSPSALFIETLCELEDLDPFYDVVVAIRCERLDIKPENVFQKLAIVLNKGAMIMSCEELRHRTDLQYLFPFLMTVFHDFDHALKARTNPSDRCENQLLENVSFLDRNESYEEPGIEDQCPFPMGEICNFLSELCTQIIRHSTLSSVESANRAKLYVNVYSKLAILRSLVLFKIFYKNWKMKFSTKEIIDRISSSQECDSSIIRCITNATVENAVFQSVFHLTEISNRNVLHFLQMNGFEIPSFKKTFYDQALTISCAFSPKVKLKMVSGRDEMYGTTENSVNCNFCLDLVEGRQLDNFFYLRSVTWPTRYAMLNEKGDCKAVDGKPGLGGQWKLIELSTESSSNSSQFLVSSVDFPDRFLYLERDRARGQTDVQKVGEKGLWQFYEDYKSGPVELKAGNASTVNIDKAESHASKEDRDMCSQLKEIGAKSYKMDRRQTQQITINEIAKETRSSTATLCTDTLLELQGLDCLYDAVLTIRYESSETRPENVFQKLAIVLNKVEMIMCCEGLQSKTDLQYLFPFLMSVFHNFEYALKTLTNISDKRKINSTFQDAENRKILDEANVCEIELLANVSFLNRNESNGQPGLEDECPFPIGEICNFLSELCVKIIRHSKLASVESANRATLYVNVYSKLAILRSLVLCQMFCKNWKMKVSTKEILDHISSSKKCDSEIVECITHATVETGVFQSVFQLTETRNKNVFHFLQMNGFVIPGIEENFYNQAHTICWNFSPEVKLRMITRGYDLHGTTDNSDECNFYLELVEGRQLDKFFYLRSVKSPTWYAMLNKKGDCTAVSGKPGLGGQWKLIELGTESSKDSPLFLVSSVDFPGRFLYLDAYGIFVCARGKRNFEKVREKGLWKICKAC